MILKEEISTEDQQIPGDRLNRILDEAGFNKVRGRSADFYDFLVKYCPEDWDLKASTVRSWFSKSAPTMKKIIQIVEILDNQYGFKGHVELKSIQGWWKVGGPDPFDSDSIRPSSEDDLKLDFVLPAMIMGQIGDEFSAYSSSELDDVKKFTMEFALAFNNPRSTKCPDKYLKMAINHALQNLKNQR